MINKRILLTIILIGSMAIAGAQNIPHKVMKRECGNCHNENNWLNIHFNHDVTKFPLIGKHLTVKCCSCHRLADFSLIKSDCVACHLDIHQGKLARDCNICHTPQGWSMINGVTAHANTSFPLLGAHARLDCKACHTGEIQGEFTVLRSDCISCHLQDFRNVSGHDLFGSIVRCEECHNLLSWQPANFARHDQQYFPIYSGAHSGRWSSCTECHRTPNNFIAFECVFCHEHGQSQMDGSHQNVVGYEWVSARCYTCHPRAQRGG